jgi:hypothetical protein
MEEAALGALPEARAAAAGGAGAASSGSVKPPGKAPPVVDGAKYVPLKGGRTELPPGVEWRRIKDLKLVGQDSLGRESVEWGIRNSRGGGAGNSVEAMKRIIQTEGFDPNRPVKLFPNGEVDEGHHRLLGTQDLGYTHIPVEPPRIPQKAPN